MNLFRRFFKVKKVKITPADERTAINDAVQIMYRIIRREAVMPDDDTLMRMQLQKRILDKLVDRYWRTPGAV
jgi:hypothetical protein